MYLPTSRIHFIRENNNGLSGNPDPKVINNVVSEILQDKRTSGFPKIQVVKKEGAYFALNSSYLHVFRELERRGERMRVRVELVPLTMVPSSVQRGMVVQQSTTEDGIEDTGEDNGEEIAVSDVVCV